MGKYYNSIEDDYINGGLEYYENCLQTDDALSPSTISLFKYSDESLTFASEVLDNLKKKFEGNEYFKNGLKSGNPFEPDQNYFNAKNDGELGLLYLGYLYHFWQNQLAMLQGDLKPTLPLEYKLADSWSVKTGIYLLLGFLPDDIDYLNFEDNEYLLTYPYAEGELAKHIINDNRVYKLRSYYKCDVFEPFKRLDGINLSDSHYYLSTFQYNKFIAPILKNYYELTELLNGIILTAYSALRYKYILSCRRYSDHISYPLLLEIWKSGSHPDMPTPDYFIDWAKQKGFHDFPLVKAYPNGIHKASASWEFDQDSPYYPEELDLALMAWRTVSNQANIAEVKNPKSLIIEWLEKESGCQLSNSQIERIATLCNWNKKGGTDKSNT